MKVYARCLDLARAKRPYLAIVDQADDLRGLQLGLVRGESAADWRSLRLGLRRLVVALALVYQGGFDFFKHARAKTIRP
jgi:hypothetical protein